MVGEKNSFKSKVRKNRVLLLMLLPACTLMFVFAYLPMGGLVLAKRRSESLPYSSRILCRMFLIP